MMVHMARTRLPKNASLSNASIRPSFTLGIV